MRDFLYPAKFAADKASGGFTVTFRDLPEAITQGDDLADALAQAADCLDEAIAGRLVRIDDIPIASKPAKGEYLIAVPPLTAAKAGLQLAMWTAGVSIVQLAKRLCCDEKEIRRMLDPKHQTKIASIHRALKSLGQVLSISVFSDAA